jgi:hypothetical protein
MTGRAGREVSWALKAVAIVFASVFFGAVLTRIAVSLGLHGAGMYMYPVSLVVGVTLAARVLRRPDKQ